MGKGRKTNLDTLLESLRKASEEDFLVFLESGIHPDEITRFIVINQEKETAYTVESKNDVVISCSCPQAVYRKQLCKHQIKVAGVHDMDLAILDYKHREELIDQDNKKDFDVQALREQIGTPTNKVQFPMSNEE